MVYKKYMLTSTPFTNSSGVYDWLSAFINFERGQTQEALREALRLDRMYALAELAKHPEKCAPSFHVAGSKGKGSVTGMIAAILEALGMKTARYASPHVCDFRERLSIGGTFFSEEIYIKAGQELKSLVDSFTLRNAGEPTFFELLTLWFFICASISRCDVMAVETGLGGRLDATNILDPLVSIITLIELEHTEYLGNTIAAIAGEKAGIVKPGKALILGEQGDEALEVFREHAARKKSPLIYFPDYAELQEIQVDRGGTSFTLLLKNRKEGEESFKKLFVPIPGEVQAKNAGLAVLAVKTAYPHIAENVIRDGLSGFTLPARFERISDTPPFVIDGAHTKRSVETCLKTFGSLYGEGGVLVFGCAAEKDVLSMAELCVSCFSRIVITKPGTFKKSKPEEIYAAFAVAAKKIKSPPELLFFPETGEAIDKAFNMAIEQGLPILGTGSFYLAGEIRSKLKALR
jgi:dihydrofolate synthase/folylpolyglutamate synthase